MPINPNGVLNKKEETKKRINKVPKNEIPFVIVEPKFSFDDIILSQDIVEEIKEVITLNNYRNLIFDVWGFNQVMKQSKNITVNFYGKSGTGKTMTAHAVAHELRKKLLIVDYSEIESKYVGETSKNLVSLFRFAEKKDVIILFDEADALLSKRVTEMHSATDVSVNQTRNVLLKLLDEYEGIVLFTTNFIQNFDHAFFRRITTHVKFDLPNKELRLKIWNHYLVNQFPVSEDKRDIIEKLSEIEEISGSDISNAVLKTAIHVILNQKEAASYEDFQYEIDKILMVKKSMDNNEYVIKERKVSKEYVKDKLERNIIENEIC